MQGIVASNWFSDLFSSTNLQILLLVGSGILAISLLVLALTRWGHSRPVWKCVILSFVAHILLMGYAYGTRMMGVTPTVVQKADSPMRVNIVEESGHSTSGEDQADSSKKPWDQFVNNQEMPELDQLDRPAIDTEVVIERTVDRAVEPPVTPDMNLQLDSLPNQFQPQEFTQSPPSLNEMLNAEDKIEPQEIAVDRMSEEAQPQPAFDQLAEMSRPEINDFEQSKVETPKPDALTDPTTENSFVTDLVSQTGEFPVAKEVLPAKPASPEFRVLKPLQKPTQSGKKLKLVANARRIADGQPMPTIYSLRNADNRLATARQRGGSIDTERAVEMALGWLSTNQEKDGSWNPRKTGGGKENQIFGHDRGGAGAQADCGITALATLAFLAGGETHFEGKYQNEVQKALEFLARQQRSDGDLSGEAKLFAKMYCHSMSLLALSEALAMTGDQRLLPVVQRGVDYSVLAQSRRDGGWRYQPGDTGDMSQFGWQVLALKSARLGGAVVPQSTFDRMNQFLNSCTSGVGKGLASYRPKQGPSTTMTAEALLCRYMLQQHVSGATVMQASRRIDKERPSPSHVNLYYWYYGTLAMYHAGGAEWDRWNDDLKTTLVGLQERQGDAAGSWPANGLWGGYGGRVYSTSMAALNLEVYYRYLPMYQQMAKGDATESGRPVLKR